MRILFIPLEFSTWVDASHFPYTGNYGFEEGFEACGVEYATLPALFGTTPADAHSWLHHARRIFEGEVFDQVWMEVVHSTYDAAFLDWVKTVAPVRIGFIWESCELDPRESINNPEGVRRRRSNLERNLPAMTHVVAVDEKDVEMFQAGGKVRAKWIWDAGIVPKRHISEDPATGNFDKALFFGALYGDRKAWLSHPDLIDCLVRPEASAEHSTPLPRLFDDLHASILSRLAREGAGVAKELLPEYLGVARTIRKKAFSLWLSSLKAGLAVVNLPQFGHAYASRVVEGMAAGRPVVTWEIPDRPRTRALFRDGEEILLYPKDDPGALAAHLLRLRKEPGLAERLARNAIRKLGEGHTTELLVRQILAWVGEKEDPFKRKKEVADAVIVSACSAAASEEPEATFPGVIPAGSSGGNMFLEEVVERGLWREGEPLRLHLGCGENRMDGYVNVDYPPSEHNVMRTVADVHADIATLVLPDRSVDEIRLHHVFEHFNRVTALALLIRWHGWFKDGGKLVIETPDIVGSAKTLLSDVPLNVKMGVVRHLAGDQAASWAYHVDHWFPERFEHTLGALGFDRVVASASSWPMPPYLSNVEVTARKGRTVRMVDQLAAADRLLWESTVAPAEKPTWEIWRRQLREASQGKANSISFGSPSPQSGTSFKGSAGIVADVQGTSPAVSLAEIHNFNQLDRDRWVSAQARKITTGARVLDVGAGTCPYRQYFSHCDYRTHDFKKYDGIKLGGTTEYGEIDYISEIDAIPVPDNSFDVILCTEVLEHVPEPIRALEKLSRILKPGGKLLLTAPLGSGLHQLPFHFYGGYTPEWYRHFGPKFGLEVKEIRPNGGFFRLLAQECARVAWTFPQHAPLHGEMAETIRMLFGETLPRYLFSLDDRCMIDQFTVGYHVEMVRSPVSGEDKPPGVGGGPAVSRVTTVVFSKDRPLQLDATLKSLFRCCRDVSLLDVHVLYKASSSSMESHYATLRKDHPAVDFLPEKGFKEDLLALAGGAEKILFLVDDNLFVRGFEIGPAIGILDQRPDVLGLSFRLGRNTTYCYPLDAAQSLPDFRSQGDGILAYPWKGASHDFGYPLEVSSSVYRASDLLPMLKGLGYNNPNTLESVLHDSRFSVSGSRPLLLTFERSVTFCAPVNRVQDEMKNRVGGCAEYTPESLADLYGRGYRLDTDAYEGLIPEACHKEVKLQLCAPAGREPLVSVVIPCYNQANYLPQAVESVAAQTYGNLEILIVNDGSPDDTSEVSRKLIAKHRGKRIRLIEKTNGGLADARNTGIREAAGEYILPLDSDDMIHPEMISKTVRVLESDRTVSIAHTDTYMFGTVKQLVQKRPFDFPAICKENFMNYCSLYRKKVWEEVGGYNHNMVHGYEDWDFWIGCGERNHFPAHVPEPLFFYRVKEESMLTKALEHDLELRARIVLNHPSVYDHRERVRAKNLLEGLSEKQGMPSQDGKGGVIGTEGLAPIVSVIVPTHNRPEMLRGALESILAQTLRDFEIIVVNDAGKGVDDVVAGLNRDGRITYVRHDRNRGLAAARNTGIRIARGKYIAYLDDDDLYYPDHLETLVTHLEMCGGKVAYTDAYRAIQRMTDRGYVTINRETHNSRDFNRDQFLVTNYVAVLCFMHEKACLEETGYFDETLTSHEDWDLWIRMSQKYDFVHIRKFTCEFSWRTDGTTMTSGIRSDYLRTMEIIYDKYRHITQSNPHLLDMQKKSLEVLRAEVCGADNTTAGVAVGEKVLVDAAGYHVESISVGRRPSTLDTPISVIIPVKNGGEDIRGLLGKIRSQKKVRDVEIIVIDSGSTDGSVAVAEGFGCRVIRIPEKDFNHGATRNLGAREARGEFLVFTVQDALPATDYWLYAMVSPFLACPELAALSSKQLVRPEADLFSLWMNEATYPSIGFVEDSIYALSPSFDFGNWKHLDSQIKRQLSFFDNVCSCVRRSVFDEIRFNPQINAEDIDFGVRLLEKRKKIGFLTTTGVYHWHERGPEHVLNRYFIGTKASLYILKNELTYFFNEHGIDWHSLAANILGLHDLVTVAIPEAGSSGTRLLDVATAFVSSMSRYMNASPEEISAALSAKTHIVGEGFKPRLLDLFGDASPAPGEHTDCRKNFLISEFMENIGHLVDFLSTRQFSSAEREKDLVSCIYKTLAVTVGEALGSYYLEAETLDRLTDDLKRMDQELAKGVCYY
ncbi:MAG: glycosyltransferase [Desulfobacteria bacterium]